MMGAGKSLIGRELSKIYNYKYYDSDKEIEINCKKNINDIFEDHGEEYFRAVEEEVCLNLLNKKGCVISLGGGSLNSLKIRNKISKNSFSIYIKVKTNILVNRLKNNTKRPLLKGVNMKSKLEELYKERKSFYNNSDLIIENNFDKKDILSKIKSNINI